MLDLPAEISGCSPIINQKIISTTFFNNCRLQCPQCTRQRRGIICGRDGLKFPTINQQNHLFLEFWIIFEAHCQIYFQKLQLN